MEKREDSRIVQEEDEDEYVYTSSDEEDQTVYDYEELKRKYLEASKPERTDYTEEEKMRDLETYYIQKRTSEGFDIDHFPSLREYYCMVIPYKAIRECAQLALKHYNEENIFCCINSGEFHSLLILSGSFHTCSAGHL